jgi:imidazolonepropionase-like amidohydrolase
MRYAAVLALVVAAAFPAGAQRTAITNVTVIDVSAGRPLADRTVVIEGNRIRSVDAAGQATLGADVRLIDGRGKFLIPGLWDMHVHAASQGLDALFLPVLVAHGVTGVREMFSRVEWIDSSRAKIARGEIVGPRIVGSGHILDGTPAIWPGSIGVATAEQARRAVDSLVDAGAQFIKVYSRLSPEAFAAAGKRARERGVPFAGHVPSLVGAGDASDAGIATIEHLQNILQACSSREEALRADLAAAVASPKRWDSAGVVTRAQVQPLLDSYDPGRCRELARRFVKNGTWMVPTSVVLRSVAYLDDTTLAQDPRLAYIPRFFSAGWNPKSDFRFRALTAEDWARRKLVYARQREIATLLHREGVRFLPGTDLANPYVFPGASLHDELASFVELGFTTAEALRAATLEPARFLGAADSLGIVAPGRLADLVLLTANPLDDVRNVGRIDFVVANGRVIDAGEREKLLEKARALAGGR